MMGHASHNILASTATEKLVLMVPGVKEFKLALKRRPPLMQSLPHHYNNS